MTNKEIIREYIVELSGVNQVNDDENLYETEILNSLDILDVISFLEETFHFSIVDDDVDMNNFNSVNALDSLVSKKIG